MRRAVSTSNPEEYQLTNDELAQLQAMGIPRVAKPTFIGDAAAINARTPAYRKMLAHMELQAAVLKAEGDIIEAKKRIDRLNGEMTDAAELRRRLSAAERERDRSIEAERAAKRLLRSRQLDPLWLFTPKGRDPPSLFSPD